MYTIIILNAREYQAYNLRKNFWVPDVSLIRNLVIVGEML